jgi:hypothetical protein
MTDRPAASPPDETPTAVGRSVLGRLALVVLVAAAVVAVIVWAVL